MNRLLTWLRALIPPAPNVRMEIYALGARHQGEALKGALAELRAPGISVERARVLQAVVRQLKRA